MSQLDKTFPTLDCSSCILTPKMGEVNAHEKINIYTYSEVEKVSGFVGDFSVEIRKKRDMWTWTNVPAAACARRNVRPEKPPMSSTGDWTHGQRSIRRLPSGSQRTGDRHECMY